MLYDATSDKIVKPSAMWMTLSFNYLFVYMTLPHAIESFILMWFSSFSR